MLKKEYLFPLTVMAAGWILFYQSFHLTLTMEQPMDSALYSRIIIIFLELMGAIYIVTDVWKHRSDPKAAAVEKKVLTPEARATKLRSNIVIVLSLAYGIGFAYIGYCVTSFAMVFTMICMLVAKRNRKEIIKAFVISMIVTSFLYVCFKAILNIYFMDPILF